MDQTQEILALRAQMEELRSQVDELRALTKRANSMVDVIKESTLTLATEVGDAHQKINSLLYENPAIVQDIVRLEEILGPANGPTPEAPRDS